MHMAVEYGRKIGFDGYFYIEPKPMEPMKHQYDFDAASSIEFLRRYDLDKDFKLNIEANHATLAGHKFQHELRVAADAGMLGSVDANQGDYLVGWDTDEFPWDVYEATFAMYEILRSGGFETGGLNFDAKNRRASYTYEDMFQAFILGMDTFALGLINAAKMLRDGRIENFTDERYSSFEKGIGKSIVDGKETLESLADYAYKMIEPELPGSGREEYIMDIVNQIIFSEDEDLS